MLTCVAFGESLQPEAVVRALVRAAQENNLQGALDTADMVKIAAHPRHGMSPEALFRFLRRIDQRKISFQEQTGRGSHDSIVVRMLAPVSMDFDLKLVKASTEKQEDHYVVVAVHP